MKFLLIIAIILAVFCSCDFNGIEFNGLKDFNIENKCIEGHIYYLNRGYNAGGIAPKLNDDGTPCKCQ